MPICKSSPATASNKAPTDISADHVTEAAQVKRTREQAYFNSYDFDAIEVLPYDGDDDGAAAATGTSQNRCQLPQVAIASSVCDSSSSRTSSTASSGHFSVPNNGSNHRFAYLQRLGAFFGGRSAGNKQHAPPANAAAAVAQSKDNFLLPRAMLKYQSVGHATSMPLTAAGQSSNGQLAMMSNAGKLHDCSHGHDSQTGLGFQSQHEIKPAPTATSGVAAGMPAPGSAATSATFGLVPPPRNKKLSIASSSSAHTADSGLSASASSRARASQVAAAAAAASSVTGKAATAIGGPNGRLGSQSHYSTDKSGSSGYYSSNVCSTYSLDEHIYCEPVIDILDASEKSKSVANNKLRPQLQLPMKATTAAAAAAAAPTAATIANSHRVDMHGRTSCIAETDADADDEDADGKEHIADSTEQQQQAPHETLPHYSDKLRILETSIENLDRHLKTFSCLYTQQHIVSFMHTTTGAPAAQGDIGEKLRAYNQLPTIMEGFATQQQLQRPHSWQEDSADDSLLDIDLDAFLLANERRASKRYASQRKKQAGVENPSFLSDEQVEENNYKCAKYINSCPEDAYRVESDIGSKEAMATPPPSEEPYVKRYEDRLHFQNTRELLEDVRDKIRLLSRSRNELCDDRSTPGSASTEIPKELEGMIQTLKHELESYLQRMNQHSELEIRQLCSGLGRNQHVLKIQNAFERRRSSFSMGSLHDDDISNINAYEAMRDGVLISASGRPLSVREQITTIRCASDPNFKMKRKSITEVFPSAECYIESRPRDTTPHTPTTPLDLNLDLPTTVVTQMQRNLTFHKPVLTRGRKASEHGDGGKQHGDSDSISEWHRKKPSIWEMYYGTNRLHQSLLGKQRNGELVVASTQPTLSYPSSRPESDFTLDLPRAEQLRLKMEKEKKFRQRCRYITTFLSLVFFLLTVMVVSLVLTRGKRMFGSMI